MGHQATWMKEILLDFREGLFEEAKATFGDRAFWMKMAARSKFQSIPNVVGYFRLKYQSPLFPKRDATRSKFYLLASKRILNF
jgi:hypothetical protein